MILSVIMARKNIPVKRSLYEQWLPVFKKGIDAKSRLDDGSLSRPDLVMLRKAAADGDIAFQRISEKVMIVAAPIINREMSKPRAFHVIIEREDLESAALEGIYSALMNMDMDRMKSPTNYVLQWIDTKVTRTALKMESSTGLSPSKLRIYKKIAAVRKTIRENKGSEPSDEEVLDYFHSGQADYKSMNGRVNKAKGVYKSNSSIRMKDIKEQKEWDDGYNLHTPITDQFEIDSELFHEDDMLENEDAFRSSVMFWTAYMDYMGISEEQQDIIAEGLNLFPVRPVPVPDSMVRSVSRDFIKLIQHPSGNIQSFSVEYTKMHGDGFWRAFVEMLTVSDDSSSRRRLHLSTLVINPQ